MSDLKKLLRCLERARNSKEKQVAAEDVAEYFLTREEFHQALEYYETALEAALSMKDGEKIAKTHRMIGEVQLELLECDEALKHTQKYYEFACSDKSRLVEQQRALTTLGRTYFVKGDCMKDKNSAECGRAYKHAVDYLWKSLRLCEKLQESMPASEINDMRARSILNLGLTFEGMGKLDDAAKQFDLAIRLCRKYSFDTILRPACSSYANLLIRQKKFADAFKLYQEAFATVKALPEKSRARIASDILFAESEAHLWKGDVHSARRALQKAYRLVKKPNSQDDSNQIIDRLKLVAAMDLNQKKLGNPDIPPDEMSKIYEELGDGFSSLGMFSFALVNYEKMLEFGKIAGTNLKACYVSLAQTCKDLKDYDKAISYFEQEMLFCDASSDACYTLLSIQECQDLQHAPLSDQLNTLNRAFSIAEKAEIPKLKKKILKELHKVQLLAKNNQDAEDTKCTLDSLFDAPSDDEDEEADSDDQEQTPNIGDYIDLDALSGSSDEEEEGFNVMENTFTMPVTPKPKRNANRRRAAEWRNDKGETKLHVACISGNIKAVQTLLGQGCDVNATDNAGWTPLHEACNHGFIDIVELLLENGANINNKGGLGTGGITPLHDAAQAGNFEVIEFLLDHNASVSVLTDSGDNALDALIAYYERSQNSLSAEEEHQYRCVKDRLKACLKRVGLPIKDTKRSNKTENIQTSTSEKPNPPHLTKQPSPHCPSGKLRRLINDDHMEMDSSSYRKRAMREVSPVSSIGGQSGIASDDDQEADEGQHGVTEYINAIQNLRKNTDNPCSSDSSLRKPLEPLVNENEVVEDWLEDDIGKQPSKKRRKSDLLKTSGKASYKTLTVKKKSSSRLSLNSCSSSRPSSVCSTDPREDSRWSTGSRNSDTLETSTQNLGGEEEMQTSHVDTIETLDESWSNNMNFCESWSDASLPNFNNTRQSSLLAFGVTRQQPNSGQVPIMSQALHQMSTPNPTPSCVNVQVENHRLAIFVQNPSNSIGWLAEEAARRYKKLEGSLPILSIYSLDGALYSDEDPVQMVLGTDVIGRAQSWNNTTITERYQEACQILSSDVHSNIMSHLEECLVTHSLDIVDTMYPTFVFKPVFRAIAMEYSLLKLDLSNNLLQDKGIMDLCENIGKLCNLKDLNLSGNNISALAVAELAKTAKKGSLKVLHCLYLSHNNLGDASLSPLIDLTASLSNLQNLYLADCMFTKAVGDKSDQHLTLNQLLTLDLSFNQLHAKGLACFLGLWDHNEARRLNSERLQSLFLIGLAGEHLCQELFLFLEQANSIALRELHFSYPSMKDEELSHLFSLLRSAPELHSLHLPSAQNIKPETVCQLLLHQPSLKQLELHNSPVMWKNIDDKDVVMAVSHAAKCALETLTVRDLPESAKDAWNAIKGTSSVVKKSALGLQVFASGT